MGDPEWNAFDTKHASGQDFFPYNNGRVSLRKFGPNRNSFVSVFGPPANGRPFKYASWYDTVNSFDSKGLANNGETNRHELKR